MTDGRIAEIEGWLRACGQDAIPTTEWAHVVRELIGGLKIAHAKIVAAPSSLLDTVEAAKRLGVAPRTVCKWCDSGKLACVREASSGNRLIAPADLEAFRLEMGRPLPTKEAS